MKKILCILALSTKLIALDSVEKAISETDLQQVKVALNQRIATQGPLTKREYKKYLNICGTHNNQTI